jgi:diadenosine tetraphosphate (Ap4A) HIT family hydrolase
MRARSRPVGASLQGWRMFTLDPAFDGGSQALADLELSTVRLQLDARFPWLVLIPRLAGAREIEDLGAGDRSRLMEELVLAGRVVRAIGEALGRPVLKLNVGALLNITPQLHVHVVGRRRDDAAWPGPVWGTAGVTAYQADVLAGVREAALRVMGDLILLPLSVEGGCEADG